MIQTSLVSNVFQCLWTPLASTSSSRRRTVAWKMRMEWLRNNNPKFFAHCCIQDSTRGCTYLYISLSISACVWLNITDVFYLIGLFVFFCALGKVCSFNSQKSYVCVDVWEDVWCSNDGYSLHYSTLTRLWPVVTPEEGFRCFWTLVNFQEL